MDDELLQQVAEIRGMPTSLVERSARAKADKAGTTVEAVLREWLGEAGTAEAQPATQAEPTTGVEPASTEAATLDEATTTEITTDHLIQLAAEARRMPPKLILSSAEARAEHAGTSLDEVLAEWAGVDLADLEERAPAGTSEPDPVPPTEDTAPETGDSVVPPAEAPAAPPTAAPAAAAAGALTMDELLDKVAEAKGMPAPLAKRSAEARAKKTGEPLEAVLAEWAGIDPATVSATPAATPPAEAAPPADAAAASGEESPESDEPDVEVIEASADAPDPARADEQPPSKGYPIWLAAAFLLIPILAVLYILVSPNGPDCGSSGQLLVDPATGEAVNCDGSAYGETKVDNFAAGGAIYQQCAACHASDGSGGVGPAFSAGAILTTFPEGSCADQIDWVALGTAGWPDPTYGATNKPVGGVGLMPGFGGSLTPEQVAQVSLYERVAFGGQALEDAEVDCGLVEAAEG